MSQVPASYIANEPIAYESEIFALLGTPRVFGGVTVRPPAVGVFALLEILDSTFISGNKGCDPVFAFVEALYVASRRQAVAESVQHWLATERISYEFPREFPDMNDPLGWCPWDDEVVNFGDQVCGNIRPRDIPEFREFLIGPSFSGFGMIPARGGNNSQFCFGAETLANVINICGASGISPSVACWDTPMATVGHLAAVRAKAAGTKGVSRPKSLADIKLQCTLAGQRAARGELHPWQIAEPEIFHLERDQVKADPGVQAKYDQLLADRQSFLKGQ